MRINRAAPVRTTVQLGVSRSTGLRSLARISRRPIGAETARRGAARRAVTPLSSCAVYRALGLTLVQRGTVRSSPFARTRTRVTGGRGTKRVRASERVDADGGRWHGARVAVTSGANFKTDLNDLARRVHARSRKHDVCLAAEITACRSRARVAF